ncbi:hypothetical protein QR680_006434 [Steinernema hermaphroditum]|uniref:Activator of Hsp90 ATPase AHSA1-like N-terminal domain-containing protein n=1 Tax=Steinernema hermaphroditum TaxID=289476 RepID=A0AA39HVE7_9BILA|nr:hypothetical protein QR680_006434 [Steinernema hermaphroditum]
MAKWGEGDPRWIVEERPDATNVNNWHWSEKNATPWSKSRLPELLTGFSVEAGPVKFEFTEIKKLEGEATANNRKAKLIFLYEWEVEVKFLATVAGDEQEYKGYIEIPNLSDENDADEIDVNFNLDTKGPFEAELRRVMNGEGTEKVREQLAIYIRELKEEFSKGLILPTEKPKQQVISKGKTVIDKKSFQNMVISDKKEDAPSKPVSNGPVPVKTYSLKDDFKCPPEHLFDILTRPEMVQKWSNGSFKSAGVEASNSFQMFNGLVSGTFEEIVPNKALSMKWRSKQYPEGHYASVKFSLVDKKDQTQLEIEASEVPEVAYEETKNAFERYYLQSIARSFGFAVRPF